MFNVLAIATKMFEHWAISHFMLTQLCSCYFSSTATWTDATPFSAPLCCDLQSSSRHGEQTIECENESCSYSQYLQSNIPPPGLEHRNSAPLRTRDQSLINPLLLQNSWADFSCRDHRNVLSRHICVSIPDLIFSCQTPPLQHSLHIKIQLKYSGFYWLYLDILKDISGTGLGLGNGGPYQCTLQ